jgi:hypothetical protein
MLAIAGVDHKGASLRCLTYDEQTEMTVEREPSIAARCSLVQVIGRHTFLFDNGSWSYRVEIDHRCLAKLNYLRATATRLQLENPRR